MGRTASLTYRLVVGRSPLAIATVCARSTTTNRLVLLSSSRRPAQSASSISRYHVAAWASSGRPPPPPPTTRGRDFASCRHGSHLSEDQRRHPMIWRFSATTVPGDNAGCPRCDRPVRAKASTEPVTCSNVHHAVNVNALPKRTPEVAALYPDYGAPGAVLLWRACMKLVDTIATIWFTPAPGVLEAHGVVWIAFDVFLGSTGERLNAPDLNSQSPGCGKVISRCRPHAMPHRKCVNK